MYEHYLPVHFDFREDCEGCQEERLIVINKLKEDSMIEGLLEQKEELELARQYRSLNASDFFEKYFQDILNPEILTFLKKIDAGIETYDWI